MYANIGILYTFVGQMYTNVNKPCHFAYIRDQDVNKLKFFTFSRSKHNVPV